MSSWVNDSGWPDGHADLLGHEVDARHHLGDGVLDLEAGVHLEEEELAVLEEELDGAGVDVAARLGDLDRGLAHRLADLGGERRRRALLDELLVAALGRAVALGDPHAVAVGVGDDLHLDVAGPGEVPLDVALVAAEALERLALGRLERLGGLVGGLHDPHAAPAAAVGGLDGDGPAELLAEGHDLGGVGEELGGAGHAGARRRPGRRCGCETLSPMTVDGLGRRADERHAPLGDGLGEVGVLGEEAVAGVHRVGAAALDDIEDRLGVEVALGGGLPTEGVGLVGEADVQGVAVEVGVHGHRGDAHLLACTDDSDSDLAAVGDEDLVEHAIWWHAWRGPTPDEQSRAPGSPTCAGSPRPDRPTLTCSRPRAEGRRSGVVLVADHQTSGRGRLGRVWAAPPGSSLLVSVSASARISARVTPSWSLAAAAVAACDACAEVSGCHPGIKWPNDLVIVAGDRFAGRKIAGHARRDRSSRDGTLEAVVVGMGLNVNWPDRPPSELDDIAVALDRVVGHEIDRDALLDSWLRSLDGWLDELSTAEGRARLQERVRNLSATVGRRVRVEQPTGELVGAAVDITAVGTPGRGPRRGRPSDRGGRGRRRPPPAPRLRLLSRSSVPVRRSRPRGRADRPSGRLVRLGGGDRLPGPLRRRTGDDGEGAPVDRGHRAHPGHRRVRNTSSASASAVSGRSASSAAPASRMRSRTMPGRQPDDQAGCQHPTVEHDEDVGGEGLAQPVARVAEEGVVGPCGGRSGCDRGGVGVARGLDPGERRPLVAGARHGHDHGRAARSSAVGDERRRRDHHRRVGPPTQACADPIHSTR